MQISGPIPIYCVESQDEIQGTVSTYLLQFEHPWIRLMTPNIFVDFHYHLLSS